MNQLAMRAAAEPFHTPRPTTVRRERLDKSSWRARVELMASSRRAYGELTSGQIRANNEPTI